MRRVGVRALLVGGAMIVACQDARDARASRATDSAKVVRVATARDSVPGFRVPAQCARGSLPVPRKPALAVAAPKSPA
ncbi:MAG: hypothetical protein JJD97_16630, partial [Gemmatimonadaceae bacterium]|nr:hypothetical protein [Gemmatimonadaceae bacterium]